jgi:hypothetical protein
MPINSVDHENVIQITRQEAGMETVVFSEAAEKPANLKKRFLRDITIP